MNLSISLLLPVYNAGPYLDEALASALQQMRKGDEIVVQDARSTDGTTERLLAWQARDVRVRVVSERDQGQADGLSRALARAEGELVGWLNADDILEADALDLVRAAFLRSHADVVVGGHHVVRSDGTVMGRYRGRALEHKRLYTRGCYVFSGSVFWSRTFLVSLGGFTPDYHYCMDLDLFLRAVKGGTLKQYVVAAPLAALRWHAASKSGGQGWAFVRDGLRVRVAHRRTILDSVRGSVGLSRQALALASTPVRHSKGYTTLRNLARTA